MTSLPIMKKSLVSRVVGNVVSQRGTPSLSPRSFTPVRLDSANQARERGRTPAAFRSDYTDRAGATVFNFRYNRGIERLVRFQDAVRPKDQPSPFHDIAYRRFEPIVIDVLHRGDHTRLFCEALSECVRGRNVELPLVECRPFAGLGSAPICFRSLPQTPGLFHADILVGVIHHGVEPSTGMCAGEVFRHDPFLEELPDRRMFGGLISMKKARTARSQLRAYAVWNFASCLDEGSHPQKECVPMHVFIGACGQLAPGHKQSILEGSLFAVESNLENEAVEVPSSHPQPVFWGRLPKLSVGFLLYQFPLLEQSSQNLSAPKANCSSGPNRSFARNFAVIRGESKAGKSIAAPYVQLRRAREDVR